SNEELRMRFVRDMDNVIKEFGMTPEQEKALRELKTDAVVEAGAHGILAITSLLSVHHALRAAQEAKA
ncbi:MAG: hypothetical protein WD533_02080, partial [Dehalococcoidia bacterium]